MEVWRDITDFEGDYEVSNYGRIKTLIHKESILKTFIINSGYESVTLKGGNKLVHRIVAREFCKGYKPWLDVNHKDGNRLNNRSDNLEWVSRKDNIADCIRRGKHNIKEAHKVAHRNKRKSVNQYTIDGEFIKTHSSIREAAKTVDVHENSIGKVCRGVQKTSKGFIWKFTKDDDIV